MEGNNTNTTMTAQETTQAQETKKGGFMDGMKKFFNHPVTKAVGGGLLAVGAGGVAGHVAGKKAGTRAGYNAGYDAATLANARAERVDVDTEE